MTTRKKSRPVPFLASSKSQMMSRRCFVCSEPLRGNTCTLSKTLTKYSRSPFIRIMQEAVSGACQIIITDADKSCQKCASLIQQRDKLAKDLELIDQTLKNFMVTKYSFDESPAHKEHELMTDDGNQKNTMESDTIRPSSVTSRKRKAALATTTRSIATIKDEENPPIVFRKKQSRVIDMTPPPPKKMGQFILLENDHNISKLPTTLPSSLMVLANPHQSTTTSGVDLLQCIKCGHLSLNSMDLKRHQCSRLLASSSCQVISSNGKSNKAESEKIEEEEDDGCIISAGEELVLEEEDDDGVTQAAADLNGDGDGSDKLHSSDDFSQDSSSQDLLMQCVGFSSAPQVVAASFQTAATCGAAAELEEKKQQHDDSSIKCKCCHKSFRDPAGLTNHYAPLLKVASGGSCSLCASSFASREVFLHHKSLVHGGAQSSAANYAVKATCICRCCNFDTNNFKEFESHKEQHLSESSLLMTNSTTTSSRAAVTIRKDGAMSGRKDGATMSGRGASSNTILPTSTSSKTCGGGMRKKNVSLLTTDASNSCAGGKKCHHDGTNKSAAENTCSFTCITTTTESISDQPPATPVAPTLVVTAPANHPAASNSSPPPPKTTVAAPPPPPPSSSIIIRKQPVYECGMCTVRVDNVDQILSHFESHKSAKINCKHCKIVVASVDALIKHLQYHMKPGQCMECQLCDDPPITLKSKDMLMKHMADLHRMRHDCKICGEQFRLQRDLVVHYGQHPESKQFACPKCEMRFGKPQQLENHVRKTHREPKCRVCHKVIGNVKKLRQHEARHGRDVHPCSKCERIFKTPGGLKNHMAVHTGVYRYRCDKCERGFMSKVMFEEHSNNHLENPKPLYQCDVCAKSFFYQGSLWIHRKWHDNPYPYECKLCGKKLRHASVLQVHMRRHRGERPYKCPYCPLNFNNSGTFKRHLMLHTGNYAFRCHDCDRGFTGKNKYENHRHSVHGDPLPEKSIAGNDYKITVPVEQVDAASAGAATNIEAAAGTTTTTTQTAYIVENPKSYSGDNAMALIPRVVEVVINEEQKAVSAITLLGDSVGKWL